MQAYCNSLTRYLRLRTHAVQVGDIVIGNLQPIRIQTMTTTDTMNNKETVAQTIRCIEAGAELVRITTPSIKEATHLQIISKELRKNGFHTPLVADVHFTPNAAEIAARLVEKVRINPGNYIDKKKFEQIEYSNVEYQAELERIRDRFLPLVKICKEYGTAMRIGTNHGSLSDRIMSRFGDTPEGMVESALEFLDICEDENYYNIVLSMKASNPQVMVHAYRLLVQRMAHRKIMYPLHVGVTEAGEGEDGRIKSAMGIGTLLEDGIGDTIRVSLTEDPEIEIPVCRNLIERYTLRGSHASIPNADIIPYNPFEYKRRETIKVNNIGQQNVPVVIADYSEIEILQRKDLVSCGYEYNEKDDKWNISDTAADYIYTGDLIINFDLPGTLKVISNNRSWWSVADKSKCYPIFYFKEFLKTTNKSATLNFVVIDDKSLYNESKSFFNQLDVYFQDPSIVWVIQTENEHNMPALRRMFIEMIKLKNPNPVIIKRDFDLKTDDRLMLYSAIDFGGLLLDGMGDGIWMKNSSSDTSFINTTCFNILQASRTRISKTEYISCPSCGRTLFNLQETTQAIRAKTAHLKGVKIAVMGCIVNGPGEMADADFGYVGSGVGKISLYKGKEIVKKNIDSDVAVEELINLIKENNMWVDEKG